MEFESKAWRVIPFILLAVMLEQVASLSIGINLFTFAFNVEHFSLTTSANIVTNFMGTMYLLSLAGGLVSDICWTKFRTILVSGVFGSLGLALLVLTASIGSLRPHECQLLTSSCEEATSPHKAIFFSGLYLLALGAGGMKGNLAAMGADQFKAHDRDDKELGRYFNVYFFHFIVGALAAVTGLVYVQEHVSFKVAYLAALGCMLFASGTVASGYPFYRGTSPVDVPSPLVSFAQVLVAAFRNRRLPFLSSDMLREERSDENNSYRIRHTDQFRFLDKAAIVDYTHPPISHTSPWKLCTVTQVEELKIVLRILPIFASTIAINCVIAQVQTVSLQQGRTMDRRITKRFEIPPASISALPLLFMIILLPIYELLFVPLARRVTGVKNGITYLQRISVGLLLAIVSMVVAAFVENKRMHVVREFGLVDKPGVTVPLKIYWITIQYMILGLADIFTFVGLMEFFYRESPERIRSIATSLSFVSLSMGYFLSSVLVSIVKKVTARDGKLGWLPSNINRGKLSNFYWLLACISAVNFVVYALCAKWYRYRSSDACDEKTVELESGGGTRLAPGGREEIGNVSMKPLIP